MRIITYFTGTDDQTTNRKALAATLLIVAVIIGMIVFGSATKASATTQTGGNQPALNQSVQMEEVLSENERLNMEVAELKEALAEKQAEREALLGQVAAAESDAEQLRGELESLRQECATAYVLRFRVERNVHFPKDTETIYITLEVNEEIYNRWLVGNIITDSTGLLSVPSGGMLHEWVIVLEDKYITTNDT